MLRSQLPRAQVEALAAVLPGRRPDFENFRHQVDWLRPQQHPVGDEAALVAEIAFIAGADAEHDSSSTSSSPVARSSSASREDWWPEHSLSSWRYGLVGRMRQQLARAAVAALGARHHHPGRVPAVHVPAARRATLAPSWRGRSSTTETLGSLLLSATPFKMYTLPDEPEGEDHYESFLQTVEFLAGPQRADSAQGAPRRPAARADVGRPTERRRQRATLSRHELRRVMVRTERLASTPDRDGMLAEAETAGTRARGQDLHDFRSSRGCATALGQQDMLEYWRSSPYVLELMDGYVVKKELERAGRQAPR